MATDKLLKFYKAGSAPSTAAVGSVWFDTTNRLINVKVADSGEKQWESYSGLQNASWIEASKTLRLVKANGENLDINLSDVASASALTLVDGRLSAVETWKSTADGDITTLKTNVGNLQTEAGKNTAKLADIAEGQTVKAVIDAAVKVEADRATGVESGFNTRIGNLETTSGEHTAAIEALQAAVGEGGDVATQIESAINTFNTSVVTPGLAGKADKATYGAYVTANDAAVAAVKKTAEDEVTRAKAAEADLQGQIDTVSADVEAAQAAADAAQKTIDDFLTGEGVDPNKVDALKEIITYMEEHGEEYEAVVENLGTLNTDMATLKGTGDGSVAKAVADAEARVNATIIANEEVTAAALTELDGRVDALEAMDLTNVVSNFEGRIAANEAAVATVDSRIATAKSGAEATAAADATSKANTAESNAKGYADGLIAAEVTRSNKYADDAVAVEAAKVAKNTTDIAALDAKITEGLSWVAFE